MGFNPVSLLLFILVFVPGYFFVHFVDYYLLKGRKSQFEKTVQGIFASTVIWAVFLALPTLPPVAVHRDMALGFVAEMVIGNNEAGGENLGPAVRSALMLYFLVLFVSIAAGNLWGLARRKIERIDWVFRLLTGRDRHRTVPLRFFTESSGSTVVVTNTEGKKYGGILWGTPDDPDISDDAIILKNPSIWDGES